MLRNVNIGDILDFGGGTPGTSSGYGVIKDGNRSITELLITIEILKHDLYENLHFFISFWLAK